MKHSETARELVGVDEDKQGKAPELEQEYEKYQSLFKEVDISLEDLKKKLTSVLPSTVALAMYQAAQQKNVSTSEVSFIADLLEKFEDIVVKTYKNGQERLVLQATFGRSNLLLQNYFIWFCFQHRIKNRKTNRSWSIDVVMQVFHKGEHENLLIGQIGFEYDGYPSHFTETKIKEQMYRDVTILLEADISILRVSFTGAKYRKTTYQSAVWKFARKRVELHQLIVQSTLKECRHRQRDSFIDCPICKNNGYFGSLMCRLCEGYGRVRESETKGDLSEFYAIPCLACLSKSSGLKCNSCGGSRVMDNIKALEYAKKHDL